MFKPLDTVFRFSFFAGFVFLAFSLGVLSSYFKWAPSSLYNDVFVEYKQWKQEQRRNKRHAPITRLSFAKTEIVDPAHAYLGYTLVARGDDSLSMIDSEGHVVHRWNMPYKNVWPEVRTSSDPAKKPFFFSGYLYPNGDVLATYHGYTGKTFGYGLVKLDKESRLVWKVPNVHHGVYVSDDKKIYALTHNWLVRPAPDVSMLEDHIVILSEKDGSELKNISIPDAFRGTPFEPLIFHKQPIDKRGNFTDASSVMALDGGMADKFPMFKKGQVLVSLSNQSCLAVIDPESKKVVWAARNVWKEQNKAAFLPNGNILIYDNKGYFNGEKRKSRIIEFNPATLAVEWEYDGGEDDDMFYSGNLGSFQVLPNGNYLVILHSQGRVIEVTHDKKIVWDSQVGAPVSSVWRIKMDDLEKNFWGKVEPRTAADEKEPVPPAPPANAVKTPAEEALPAGAVPESDKGDGEDGDPVLDETDPFKIPDDD